MIPPIPALQSGFATVRRGTDRLDAAAATLSTAFLPVAGQEGPAPDTVGALVEMMLARHQVGVGARVIERASRLHQDTLDLLV